MLSIFGANSGSVSWNARKQLSRAVRVDRRAEPDDADVRFWDRAESSRKESRQRDVFPERICDDELGPDDFTESHIEAYEEDCLFGASPTLLIYVGDAVFSPDDLYGNGSGVGYAVGGEFFEALNDYAKSLETGDTSIYDQPPEGFLAERYTVVPRNNKRQKQVKILKLDHIGPDDDAETMKFNVLREHPERRGAFEYLGIYSFRVDRAPLGRSLTSDMLDTLDPHERPDVISIGDWDRPEDAQQAFEQAYGHGRQRMLYYLPRIPYFEAKLHGSDQAFKRKMVEIRRRDSI